MFTRRSMEGGGVHLSYSSNSGAAKICQRGQSEGARGGCGRGVSHGREIFQNLCMKLAFSSTLETIIRGSLCTGMHRPIPYSFSLFILFLMNLFQGNIVPFSLSFSLFFAF